MFDNKFLKSMTDAYRQVLEGKAPTKRESWVPASIQDEDVSDFMGAAANAHKNGKDSFEFGGKKYKVTMKKDTAAKVNEAEVEACPDCGKVHEGSCEKSDIKKDKETEEMKKESKDKDEDEEEQMDEVADPEAKGEKEFKDAHKVDKKELPAGVKGHK